MPDECEMVAFQHVLSRLNSLQSNRATLVSAERLQNTQNDKRNPASITGTIAALRRAGYSVDDFCDIRIVHIAGSKGKGSTCAFLQQILVEDGVNRVGMFTSPHLVDVRERIRINGEILPRNAFTRYFDQVWGKCVDGLSGDVRSIALILVVKWISLRAYSKIAKAAIFPVSCCTCNVHIQNGER